MSDKPTLTAVELVAILKANKCTGKRLAEILGVTRQSVSNWTTGRFNMTRAMSNHIRLLFESEGSDGEV